MRALAQLYHPVTGTPFQQDESYQEIAPCAALAPYIRCFWGSERPLPEKPHSGGIIIPDTCMDIIFHVDYAANRLSAHFCALDETSALTAPCDASGGLAATFAIRFYAWSACLFAEAPLRGSVNCRFPADMFFSQIVRALSPMLFDETTLLGKIRAAERILLHLFEPRCADPAVLNAVHHILRTSGRTRISEVSAALALSPRQLERRFDACMGVTPKTLASLMRYQLLWQELLAAPHFDVQDAVCRFGYADQSHLLNDFRRRHLMSPREALTFARRQHVAFLQDESPASR